MLYQLFGLVFLFLGASLTCGQTTQNDSLVFEGQTTQNTSLALEGGTTQNNSSALEDSNSTYLYEDQEHFQDQELFHHYGRCDEKLMREGGEVYCWTQFHANMIELGEENWCNVEMIVRSYHELTECLEQMSRYVGCYYPNRVVEKLFVAIHQEYFHSCDEDELPDAPVEVVLASTLLPIFLLPFIVYIVVWKSSLRD